MGEQRDFSFILNPGEYRALIDVRFQVALEMLDIDTPGLMPQVSAANERGCGEGPGDTRFLPSRAWQRACYLAERTDAIIATTAAQLARSRAALAS